MATILRIDASPRQAGSHSRKLGDHFEQAWLQKHPEDRFVRRDLATTAIGHLDGDTINAFITPPDQLTADQRRLSALSDELLAELKAADVLVFTVPMYNFGVPSVLKAWVDHIVRMGHTFAYEDGGYRGLLTTECAYVLGSYGARGYGAKGPMAQLNFIEPYMKALLGFLGVDDVQCVAVEGTSLGPDSAQEGFAAAQAAVDDLI